MASQTHYQILGLNSSATEEEIRRAYRILARRYHPDLNPGKSSEEKFKGISEAHRVLSDAARRRSYDLEIQTKANQAFARGQKAYQESGPSAIRRPSPPGGEVRSARNRFFTAQESAAHPQPSSQSASFKEDVNRAFTGVRKFWDRVVAPGTSNTGGNPRKTASPGGPDDINKISVIEVSVSMVDALRGVKKTVEIAEPEGSRKVSVAIPPGVRNGSVIHLRSKGGTGEALVIIVRVAHHPFLTMLPRGLVVEVPISVQEAISGATITVPGLDDSLTIRVPAGTQSGQEIRVPHRGIAHRDGTQGDLFFRFLIRIPENHTALGLADKAGAISAYYEAPLRQGLPQTLLALSGRE